jgi:hypothetical protein
MRTVHFRSLALSAVAALTFAATGAAQDRAPALLNNLEVRQLVARAEPSDQAQLSAHFTALADRYAAEAKRHLSMSQSFIGNPSRNLGTGMSAHCKQLASLNTQSETAVRELAAYHAKLAGGTPATPPKDGARFQSGAGAREPTEKELSALAERASTPADHRDLEEYFATLAKRYTRDAEQHAQFAAAYRNSPRIAHVSVTHDRLAELSRDAAKEATAAAEMHKQLAGAGR